MDIYIFLKSVIDSDCAPVVICNLEHTIVYMNPSAAERYAKRGGYGLIGSSLLDCHNNESNEKIIKVVDWFRSSSENNIIFTFHNTKENKDVYMVALRNEKSELIGYYEKHEYRAPEKGKTYSMIQE